MGEPSCSEQLSPSGAADVAALAGVYLDPVAHVDEEGHRDDRARLALLGGQLGILASVVMFIIDLPDRETPEDIPYDPKPIRFGLRRDGGAELGVRLRFGGF